MTVALRDDSRWVIPRWRDSILTARIGEMSPLTEMKAPRALDPAEFEHALRTWAEERTLGTAFEILAGGMVHGRAQEARDAAEFVLASPSASPLSKGLANTILEASSPRLQMDMDEVEPVTLLEERVRIAAAKRLLVGYPNNPLLWADLARSYILVGQAQPALRAMRAALAIAPNNRFVLRAATRLYIHDRDPGKALDLLRRSPATLRDPWLLAAQLATSEVAEAEPLNVKRGMELIQSGHFSPFQISELASAIASIEFGAGNPKIGKRLVKLSLAVPTENAFAQAIWMAKKIKSISVQTDAREVNRSFEAQARLAALKSSWKEAVASCRKWCLDEPFSARPTGLGSYLACTVLEDPEMGVEFAEYGLKANPNNVTLLNNKAVALADLGRVGDGWRIFRSIKNAKDDPRHSITLTATEGLFRFRFGQPEQGRALYRKAIELAEKFPLLKGMALIHLIREEARMDLKAVAGLLPEAEVACQGVPEPVLQTLLERLRVLPKEQAEKIIVPPLPMDKGSMNP